jgi:hypothetical protein
MVSLIKRQRVCKLLRNLYGLKRSPRCWNKRFKDVLMNLEFQKRIVAATNRQSINIFLETEGGVSNYSRHSRLFSERPDRWDYSHHTEEVH